MADMFHADRPIEDTSEDRLGRAGLARMIAGQITSAPANDGFIIGLLGPWGSGKTSILNLVKKEIEKSDKAAVIQFNPWLFSGTEQLMGRFISALSAEIRLRPQLGLADVGKLLEAYGVLIGPLELVPLNRRRSACEGSSVCWEIFPKQKSQPRYRRTATASFI